MPIKKVSLNTYNRMIKLSHKYYHLIGLSIIFLLLSSSCLKNDKINLYFPTDIDTTANATLDELKQGRELYINNCKRCHNLYSPDDFSSDQWNNILSTMGPKTAMSEPEVILVKKYVSRGL